MPQTSSTAVPVIPRHAYRIVLFGMPDAGKSSLLGALAQAAQTQEQVLAGKLIDKSHGLVELQRRLYEDRPRETLEEVAPYPITIEPLPSKDGSPGGDAVLFDCDGRVASEMLSRKDALSGDLAKRALVKAVLAADTLVLVVDISAQLAELKRDFGQFARFLRVLEEGRGQRTEIGGLPVFLVLTKCDLLAKPQDTTAVWMDNIEERKRQVHQRFQEFLEQQAEHDQMPFGRIDLHVWATAIKRPALADAPAKPKEPFGVAELFRQCLDSARDFRDRSRHATERLGWVVGVLSLLVGFMVILALFFLATRYETEVERFEKDLKTYRAAHNENAVLRLREPVGKTIKELRAYRDNPQFAKMPPELQAYVVEHLQEAEAYEKFSQEWQAYIKAERLPEAPRFAHNDAELNAFRDVLKKYPVPEKYQSAWVDTNIARTQRLWRDEIEVMESEVKAAIKAFKDLEDLDSKAKDIDKYTGRQLKEFREQLEFKIKNWPYRADNLIALPNSRVTYSNIAQFETVAVLVSRYQLIREHYEIGKGR
ncbi:MAG TPA: GTPase domain-containing protein [Gemmataceae bacterium]|nr:GTPase domain-containing protein [Gemmataceae bacterium]